jgi:hypothetical protein
MIKSINWLISAWKLYDRHHDEKAFRESTSVIRLMATRPCSRLVVNSPKGLGLSRHFDSICSCFGFVKTSKVASEVVSSL